MEIINNWGSNRQKKTESIVKKWTSNNFYAVITSTVDGAAAAVSGALLPLKYTFHKSQLT